MTNVAPTLKPRKSAVQARSAVTIEALHIATIQVLTSEGLNRCTTTRIAKRAGTSVGSLYQYYPNRDALLAAVLGKRFGSLAETIEHACTKHQGRPVAEMVSALVDAFLAVKLRNPEESKALYMIAEARGGAELVARLNRRAVAAIATLLASAPDARFDDPAMTSTFALSAMLGPVRTLLEGHAPAGFEACIKDQLVALLTTFLQSHQFQPESEETCPSR